MLDFERDTAMVGKVLNALDVRAKAILENLANKNTPAYKRYTVSFEELMKKADQDGKDLLSVEPVVERDMSGPPGQNNVDMLTEMSLLEKVSLMQDLFTRRAGSYFTTMNKAIFGR